MERQARLRQLECDVVGSKAMREALCARVAVVAAPAELLSDGAAYASESERRLASLQRVRAEFLETISVQRAEALRRKQSREQRSLIVHSSVVDCGVEAFPIVSTAPFANGLCSGVAREGDDLFEVDAGG